MCIILTGILPPIGGVVLFFVLAFVREVFGSWAEFMVGLILIDSSTVASNITASPSRTEENNTISLNDNNRVVSDKDDDQTINESHNFTESEKTASREAQLGVYQSQAFMYRSLGSLSATALSFSILLFRYWQVQHHDVEGKDTQQLNSSVVTSILIVTGILPLVSCAIVCQDHTGSKSYIDYQGIDSDILQQQQEHHLQQHTVASTSGRNYSHMVNFLVFQSILIVTGLKSPIISITSSLFWKILVGVLVITLILLNLQNISCNPFKKLWYKNRVWIEHSSNANITTNANVLESTEEILNINEQWEDEPANDALTPTSFKSNDVGETRRTRVGLYLILRNAIPSSSVLLSSFFYTTFSSQPLYLQTLSILGLGSSTIASWVYGKYIAESFSAIKGITAIIVIMTLATSLWSLLDIPFVHVFRNEEKEHRMTWLWALLGLIQIVASFLDTLSFLPSVVLATNSAKTPLGSTDNHNETQSVSININNTKDETNGHANVFEEKGSSIQQINLCHTSTQNNMNEGIQYGMLISCIDFGDQIGDWVTVPIVSALNIQRDNDYMNLEWMIVIAAVSAITSLIFLRLIPNE